MPRRRFRAASPVAATSGDAGAASKLRLSVRAFLRASFFAPSGSSIASYSEGVLRTYSASSARFTNLDVVVASALPRVPSPHVVTKNAFAQALSANVIRLVAATGTTTFRTCRYFWSTRVSAAGHSPIDNTAQNAPTASAVAAS